MANYVSRIGGYPIKDAEARDLIAQKISEVNLLIKEINNALEKVPTNAGSITYNDVNTKLGVDTTQDAIEKIVTLAKESTGAIASGVEFNNVGTGLKSTNMQDATVEVLAKLNGIEISRLRVTDIPNENNNVTPYTHSCIVTFPSLKLKELGYPIYCSAMQSTFKACFANIQYENLGLGDSCYVRAYSMTGDEVTIDIILVKGVPYSSSDYTE